MKNPNGYRSAYKLSGNRRRLWTARVTVGWTDDGRHKYKNITKNNRQIDTWTHEHRYHRTCIYPQDARTASESNQHDLI